MQYFVTGIGTEVGKTVASAVLVEALQADYWKPIQSGDLENSDTDKVNKWVTNPKTRFHSNAFALNSPLSPHISAAIDAVIIRKQDILVPETPNDLVIEGAGGLMVPLNHKGLMIADLIPQDAKVVLVTKHYLGSINHTLLSLNELAHRGFKDVLLVINGEPNLSSEDIITRHPIVGKVLRLPWLDEVNSGAISKVAQEWKSEL